MFGQSVWHDAGECIPMQIVLIPQYFWSRRSRSHSSLPFASLPSDTHKPPRVVLLYILYILFFLIFYLTMVKSDTYFPFSSQANLRKFSKKFTPNSYKKKKSSTVDMYNFCVEINKIAQHKNLP